MYLIYKSKTYHLKQFYMQTKQSSVVLASQKHYLQMKNITLKVNHSKKFVSSSVFGKNHSFDKSKRSAGNAESSVDLQMLNNRLF